MEANQTNQPTVDTSKAFAAIDVGTTKIVALVGYKNESGKIVVLGKGETLSAGITTGSVSNVFTASKSITVAVEEAKAEAGFFPEKVVVGVAGRHIRSGNCSVPRNREDANAPITQEELNKIDIEAKNFAEKGFDEEIIHCIPIDYLLDNQDKVNDPLNLACSRIVANYHVVYGKTNSLNQLRQCIQNAGLQLESFQLEPLASAAAVLTPEQCKLGVALVDIGGGTTDIAIFKNNKLCTTEVVPIAGNLITNDIKESCEISECDAENIKIEYGEAVADFADSQTVLSIAGGGVAPKEISLKTLAGIIQARVEDMIDSFMFVIGTSPFKKDLGAGLVITGGGANLKNLPQLLAFKCPLSSQISSPNQRIMYRNKMWFDDTKYATVVGLLMEACKCHEQAEAAAIVEQQAQTQIQEQQEQTVTNGAEADAKVDKKRDHGFRKRLVNMFEKAFDVND